MKSFLPAFVAAVIAAALTAGALELVREDSPARATTSAAQPAFEPAGPAIDRASDRSSPLRPTSLDDPLELDRIAALELRIEELERRLAADGRRVVETADDAVASLADPEARAMILSVLAEEEARREEEREARRAERELDQLTR
ncbi:MAG: hypothetical protein O7B99_00120, partial [Planctomycetota bacterium]|nr:hypothetical protein [Planctomycetota bacterium]